MPEKDKRNLQKPVYIQIKNSNLPIIIQYLHFYYGPGIIPDHKTKMSRKLCV